MVIAWSIPARQDLRLIYQYIAHDSKRFATRVIQDITDKVEVLAEFPRLGRVGRKSACTPTASCTS